MGVYIDMEMPEKTYAHCMLIKDLDGSVQLHVCTKNSEEISEWEYFDLVPVPPHGDLIDRDATRESIKPWSPEDERNGCTFDTVKKLMYTMLDRAPTIIPADPAEEGE